MYTVNGFYANVPERDLRWLCVLLKTLSDWPDKSRIIFDCVDKYGGFLLMTKPKDCLSRGSQSDLCYMCRNFASEIERVKLHRFLETMYEIGHLKMSTRGISIHLVKFMSMHRCKLFKKHNFSKPFGYKTQ